MNQSDNEIAELLLYESKLKRQFRTVTVLRSFIKFIIKSERFSGSVLQLFQYQICILSITPYPNQLGVYVGLTDQNHFL